MEKERKYVKGKGFLVGQFMEEELRKGIDKLEVKKAKEETGLKYTNSSYVKRKGEIVGLKLYVCTAEEMNLWD